MQWLLKACGVLGFLAALAGAAQGQSPAPLEESAIDIQALGLDIEIQQQILHDPDRFLERVFNWLNAQPRDGVFRLQDLRERTERVAKQRRTMRRRHFYYADKDRDGDLSVNEINEMIQSLSGADRDKFINLIANTDSNADGFATATEIADHLDRQPDPDFTKDPSTLQMLSFDLNGNDEVDASEITRVVRAVAAKNAITRPNGQPAQPGDRMDRPLSRRGTELLNCGYPDPSPGAQVILLTTFEAYALSSVALDTTQDVTTVAVLQIEKGDKPLYLFAVSSRRVIFELRGEVGRVQQIVTGSMNGIVGVGRDRVFFAPDEPSGCVTRYHSNKGETADYAQDLAVVLIQEQVSVVAQCNMGVFGVPGGGEQLEIKRLKAKIPVIRKNRKQQVETAEGGLRPMAKDEIAIFRLNNAMRKRYPAGVHLLDASTVVANVPVIPYRTLPAEAGLIALIKRGDIRAKEINRLTIVKPIEELPALSGQMGMAIQPGVPLPRQPSKSIWIKDEKSLACVSEASCPKP